MPASLAVCPLLALALLAGGAFFLVRHEAAHERRPRGASLCWLSAPALALLFAAVWCLLGLYRGGVGELLALDAAALVAGAAALFRDRLLALLDGTPHPRAARLGLSAAALLVCAYLGHLALELPYNFVALAFEIEPFYVLLETALIAGILLFLLLLFQRSGAGLALGVTTLWVAGLAQFFVKEFKGTAILPSDLLALGTAATVSGGYVYEIDGPVLLGLCCVMLACAVATLSVTPSPRPGRTRAFLVRAHVAGALVALVALGGCMGVPSYEKLFGMKPNYWNILSNYCRRGMLTTFVTLVQNMRIEVPEGYDDASAAELEASYAQTYDEARGSSEARTAAEAQFSEVRPSVICIMDEAFSDLSIYEGKAWGYEGPSFYSNVSAALMRGSAATSVLGAGTCNSEFELLTGVAVPYVGDGKYPYQLYDLSESPSLAKQFSELGYETTAMHPNNPNNWNRSVIYEQLGFDRFLSFEDFPHQPALHNGVTDGVTYDKILEILGSSDEPQFIFDVTMQNHGGYENDDIPEELYVDRPVDGLDESYQAQLNEYLSCIAQSDRDLQKFLATLWNLDRPVVVVFFGDHQPSFASELNDLIYADEDPESPEHIARTYQTTYLIWANYDVLGNDQVSQTLDAGVSTLGAMMAEAIGAPLTDFQKAQLVATETMPILHSVGVHTTDGSLIPIDDVDALPEAYDDLARITYLEFASNLE
ncbi:LTA synthase family protein [Olsenella sp. An293]|uniref:LTA synthase family protein n=1 Tax=Olsenella sp. An293 TaxID=1965626 RepID=UPI000B397EA7|nr:LTA synthase family protein [Olsenella sp. An293]OUO33812.1 hypothetical protein B5F85_00320 [Olsenella sp. An293]